MSVFAGGWTLGAAEAICSGGSVEIANILDLLAQLVNKSLVVVETEGGEARYRLLDSVRQYGLEWLVEFGETDTLRTRHRDWYLALAERAEPQMRSRAQKVWSERLEADHDNLRAALEWSLRREDPDVFVRLVKALYELWEIRGHWEEGLRWLESALATTNDIPSRAWALHQAGNMARRLGNSDRATALLQEAVTTYRTLNDKDSLAETLMHLGILAYRQADFGKATALLEEAVALSRQADNRLVLAFSLYLMGVVARITGDYQRAEALCSESWKLTDASGLNRWGLPGMAMDGLGLAALCQGHYDRARLLCEKALVISREEKYAYGIIASLNSLALVSSAEGNDERAAALCGEALLLSRARGDKGATARALNISGRVAFHRGNRDLACEHYQEALALFRNHRDRLGIAQCLERLGCLANESAPSRGARLLAAAQRAREILGAPAPMYDRVDLEWAEESMQKTLSDAAFDAAWAEGRAMTLEQVVEYALAAEAD